MPIRNILITACLTLIIFAGVTYTACKKDPCSTVVCLNLGACDGGQCVCPVGFEGNRCQILSRDKFIKTFNGIDTCSFSLNDSVGHILYPISFRNQLSNPREMVMKNILNDMDDSAICTMQGVDSFSFQGSNNTLTYSGRGKVSNDSLWLVYHVERDTTSFDCSFFGQGLR